MNDFGKYLLNVCDEFGLCILNGLFDENDSANFTYISPTGCSVVDYFIVSKMVLQFPLKMNVGQRIESKHMPVELSFNFDNQNKDSETEPVSFKLEKFIWKNEKVDEFLSEIRSPEINQIFAEAKCLISTNINQSVDKFAEGLLKAGACMKTVIHIGQNKSQKWFDKECRESRKTVRQKLRKFNNTNSPDDSLLYHENRRQYKELLRQKKGQIQQ